MSDIAPPRRTTPEVLEMLRTDAEFGRASITNTLGMLARQNRRDVLDALSGLVELAKVAGREQLLYELVRDGLVVAEVGDDVDFVFFGADSYIEEVE